MKLYVVPREDGYLGSWCIENIYDDGDGIECEYNGEINDDLYDKTRAYHIVDGKLVFDKDRWKKLSAPAPKPKSTLELLTEALDKSKPTVNKEGYHLELIHNEGMFVWEFVKDEETPTENDGTDYLKPITYSVGMTVHTGLWYTDGDDIWEAIADGIPTDFTDKDYFDIIG